MCLLMVQITYPRPSTAPGNIQQPLRLQPLYGNVVTEASSKTGLSSRPKFITVDKEYHFTSEVSVYFSTYALQ